MPVARRFARTAGWLAAEGAVVVALVRLGRRPPFVIPLDDLDGWASHTAPVEACAALARVLALAGMTWMLASTLAYLALALVRGAAVPGRWTLLVLPGVRRAVDRSLAAAVLAGAAVIAAPAGAPVRAAGAATIASRTTAPSADLVRTVRDGRAAPYAAVPTTAPLTAGTPTAAQAAAPTTSAAHAPTPLVEVVVRPGDSLWTLAAGRLADDTGTPAARLDEAALTRYWMRVCTENRSRLQSGDPNVIFPGERVVLPAP